MKANMMVEATTILKLLERYQCFDNFFPVYFAYAGARLTAFRDSDEWIVALEVIGYDSKGDFVTNIMSACGNKLIQHEGGVKGQIKRLLKPSSSEELPWYRDIVLLPDPTSKSYPHFEEDENGTIVLNPLDFRVSIRGYVRRFMPTYEDYERQGIDLSKRTSAPEIDALVKIVRYLCATQPESLFHAPIEILSRLGRSATIPVFIQAYGWRHPDFRKQERISDSPCLRKLAEALASNDRSLYDCPEDIWNTHWSFWPEWPD